MRYRNLGRTGLQVSEIGFSAAGTGATSWTGGEKRSLVRALIAAYDAGINFFDTSWLYGRGESERLLARVFGKSMNVIVASKVPPRNGVWTAAPGMPFREVFPIAHVLGFLRKTVSNLRRDAVDLYQFPVWNDQWIWEAEWPELLEQVRRTGWARFIGISISDRQTDVPLAALGTGMIDTVQVPYDFLDPSADEHLFPLCIERGIGVIARCSTNGAGLSGSLPPDRLLAGYQPARRHGERGGKPDVLEHVQRISAETGIATSALAMLALRFCLSHPAVSTVIPELRTTAQVRDAAAAAEEDGLDAEMIQKLRLSLRGKSSAPVHEPDL